MEAPDLPLAKTNLVRDLLTTFHIQDKVVPEFDCDETGEQSLSAEHIVHIMMETDGPALPQKQSSNQHRNLIKCDQEMSLPTSIPALSAQRNGFNKAKAHLKLFDSPDINTCPYITCVQLQPKQVPPHSHSRTASAALPSIPHSCSPHLLQESPTVMGHSVPEAVPCPQGGMGGSTIPALLAGPRHCCLSSHWAHQLFVTLGRQTRQAEHWGC